MCGATVRAIGAGAGLMIGCGVVVGRAIAAEDIARTAAIPTIGVIRMRFIQLTSLFAVAASDNAGSPIVHTRVDTRYGLRAAGSWVCAMSEAALAPVEW